MNYYTYAYLRENGTPYYIGKGHEYRINDRRHTVSLPPKERRLILKNFDNEDDAFKHEIYMISVLGRKDKGTGILRNRTAGGEGTANVIRSQEHLDALYEGRKHIYTPEHAKKISETLKAKNIKPPLQTGKKWWYNDAGETTLSHECPGPGWCKGRPSALTWYKLNQTKSKNIKPSLQTGKKWWNNGIETTLSHTCPGPDWKQGRKQKCQLKESPLFLHRSHLQYL